MVIALHNSWKSRVAVRYADVDARPVCHYFTQGISQIREVYKVLEMGLFGCQSYRWTGHIKFMLISLRQLALFDKRF